MGHEEVTTMSDSHIRSKRHQRHRWDTTEHEQALEARREESGYLENIFNYASAPILVWDAYFTITRANRAFERLTGLPPDQIIGSNLTNLFPYEQIERSLDLISVTYSGERWESVEIPVVHLDGSRRIVLWNSTTIFEADGITPKATIAQGVDITERKTAESILAESEEKYRAMVGAINGFVYICSADYRIEYMNDQLIQRTGRDATGDYCYKALHNLDSICEWCVNEQVFKGETVLWDIQSPKDGRWYEVSNSPIFKTNGTISKQAIINDITERKMAETEILRAKNASESATKAKSAFLAAMSHEIRTPMNAMMGSLTLLGTTSLTGAQQKYVQDCSSSSHILLRVINDILDFSKIEAGRMELMKESISPTRILESLVNLFASRAKEKLLRLHLVISGELPEFILGDRQRFSQIILNLLSNAIKFTAKGEIKLSASTKTSDQGTLQLIVSVSDSGVGIPPEQHSAIFESFTQLEDFNSRRNAGTGLGLAICTRLVALMDGEITLSSVPGEGSTFSVTIPVTLSEAPAKAKPKKVILGTARNILLADDEPVGSAIAVALLERNGHTVKAVEDGDAILELLQRERFDILLTDISMPRMNGTEVAQIIRSGKREGIDALIPIIAMTAHAFPEDREHFLSCGMNDYISKPINFDRLLELIEEICGNEARTA
jgi:two-component system, sensor histidine kinase